METAEENRRKPISKKLRFEVFKRDSFTCQYCGQSAPTVLLQVDHIDPVANGGKNTLLNLVTSCFNCNSGKGARTLSDSSAVSVQMNQLKALNERREQLKMIADWRNQLMNLEQDKLEIAIDHIREHYECGFSEVGKSELRKTLKKYGLEMVLEAAQRSANQYLRDRDSHEDREKFISYIPRICYWMLQEQKDPKVAEFSKICGVASKRWYRCYKPGLWKLLKEYDEAGISTEDMFHAVLSSTGIMAFEKILDEKLGID